ncbi:ABC transporter substrate-binding protein [Bogoriella caseilytica]|uniref:Carbohydrate ABC transporter substrate-binding protein (CUT1 family) n=1 Tax=Bogoriella caseilytica TaxID=56055 RepID=A0A3N2BC69_9MICO|nr:sugar ABC transporter substrate-binding protein [Bogoriella caseilytica]ROR72849.1 carbohydrate ABC transporter substrate-binding protein (CUT1 family) [Bogoriella caseilytica]
MRTTNRRRVGFASATLATVALVAAACSPDVGGNGDDDTGEDDAAGDATDDGTDEGTGDDADLSGETVTLRYWDELATEAYEASFAELEAQTGITVELEQVPWGDYWDRLPLDLSSGTMADIFWTNTSNFQTYVTSGSLLEIDEALTDHDDWVQGVEDLYTYEGTLYGVPQFWDALGLFYNVELVEAAGVDVENLRWDPAGPGEVGPEDTLLEAAEALTGDGVYGFNSQADLQAIYLNFLAQNGAQWQDEDYNFAFASEEGVQTFQYLVDLINEHEVAPSAADTNLDGDLPQSLFLREELALFQTGNYRLRNIADNAEFEWALAPIVEGPEGRIGVVNGISAVANADTENEEAVIEVLRWLGTAEGQAPLGDQGSFFPAVLDAQQAYLEYWEEQGVDIQAFLDAAEGESTPPPAGPNVQAANNEITPLLQDMFLGNDDVATMLERAQDAGNAEIGN